MGTCGVALPLRGWGVTGAVMGGLRCGGRGSSCVLSCGVAEPERTSGLGVGLSGRGVSKGLYGGGLSSGGGSERCHARSGGRSLTSSSASSVPSTAAAATAAATAAAAASSASPSSPSAAALCVAARSTDPDAGGSSTAGASSASASSSSSPACSPAPASSGAAAASALGAATPLPSASEPRTGACVLRRFSPKVRSPPVALSGPRPLGMAPSPKTRCSTPTSEPAQSSNGEARDDRCRLASAAPGRRVRGTASSSAASVGVAVSSMADASADASAPESCVLCRRAQACRRARISTALSPSSVERRGDVSTAEPSRVWRPSSSASSASS